MVRSIQPEWIAGAVAPPRARETIAGIFAGYMKEKGSEKKSWHEQFRKPWHRGQHARDFCGQTRGAKPTDHRREHYEPGRKALEHHLHMIETTESWRQSMLFEQLVRTMLARNLEIDKGLHRFRAIKRQKDEQRYLWSKSERRYVRLEYIKDSEVAEFAPRARDFPELDPLKERRRTSEGTSKRTGLFRPEYSNLPALDRQLANSDSLKRGLLTQMKENPGTLPKIVYGGSVWEVEASTVLAPPESVAAAREVDDIRVFERNLVGWLGDFEAKKLLQPEILDTDFEPCEIPDP